MPPVPAHDDTVQPDFAGVRSDRPDVAHGQETGGKSAAAPTPAQAEAGNYKKRHIFWNGLRLAIENAKGSVRKGVGADGKPWSVKMPHHYGYINGTKGKDGDQVDLFMGPDRKSPLVFVVNQRKPDSAAFDEHKCMAGFHSADEATAAYDAAYAGGLGPKLRDSVKCMSVEKFKAWLKTRGATQKAAKIDPKAWKGVDLDGTLAKYFGFKGDTVIGPPVPKMVRRVKGWLAAGDKVRIMTARAGKPEAEAAVKAWCRRNLGKALPVTNVKDHHMTELWDDRAHRVERNTGVKLAQYAPGIWRKGDLGDPASGLREGELVKYVLQHHQTVRNPKRPHYDLRLGTPDTGLFSWAVPGAQLPTGSQRKLAPQTEVHDYGYGDFAGRIGKGYGAGQVTQAANGRAVITRASPHTISFTLADSRVPTRYALVKLDNGSGRDWLLVSRPVGREGVPGVGDKPVIRKIEAQDLDSALDSALEVQEKLDGAHGVFDIDPQGRLEAYSVRRSVTGAPIVHTEQLGLGGVRVPELANTTFRGEMLGMRGGKAIPFSELSGILNSAIGKAIDRQRAEGIEMKGAPFALLRYRGEPADLSPDEERAALENIVSLLPKRRFLLPERATTPEDARALLERIRAGRQPTTAEGIIIRTPQGLRKFPLTSELTGTLSGVYPGARRAAGGLLVATEGAPEPLRVGTGFTDAQLSEIVANLRTHRGRPVRVAYKERLPSGMLRAPSFQGFETDKPDAGLPKAAVVERQGDQWVLRSHKGKALGTHPSKEAAMRQERAIQSGKHAVKTAQWTRVLSWLGRGLKTPLGRDLAGRAAMGAGGWAAAPYAQEAFAGGEQNLPQDRPSVSRLITALSAAAMGPKFVAKHPATAPALLMLPSGTSGTVHRLVGPGDGDQLRKAVLNLSTVLGQLSGKDPAATERVGQLAEAVGQKTVDIGKTQARNWWNSGGKQRIGDWWRQNLRPALQETLRDSGKDLGVGALGTVAGYGVGNLLASRLPVTTPADMRLDPADPASVDRYYEERQRREDLRKAIGLLTGALGGAAAVAGYRRWHKAAQQSMSAQQLYPIIAHAETGSYTNPWLRTTDRGSDSTAYGPVQMTKKLVADYLQRQKQLFAPDEHNWITNRFMPHAKQLLRHGNRAGRAGYNPVYDYGGGGTLTNETDKVLYRAVAERIMQHKLDSKADLLDAIRSWRGDKIADPAYYRRVTEAMFPTNTGVPK